MAITTARVEQTTTTVTYSSVNDNAVTFMSLCNFTANTVTVDIHTVPALDTARASNLIISQLDIVAGDTYILYQGNEKIVLGDTDKITVVPSGTVTDPIVATALVADTEYRIVSDGSGSTDFTAIGANEFTDGTDPFIVGNQYIITSTGGSSDFTLIGAADNNIGTIFIAGGTTAGGTDTIVDTIFTATGAGTGTGTARAAVLSIMTSFVEV